jgi:uncharacterized protein
MRNKFNPHKILQAIDQGDVPYIRDVLDRATVNRPVWAGLPALAYATDRRRLPIVKALISLGADVNRGRNGHTPLFIASGRGDKVLVSLLLEAGADPNKGIERTEADLEQGNTPFMAAASGGSRSVMELLLRAGAKPDAQTSSGLTPVGAAILADRTAWAKELIKLGYKPGTWSLLKAVADRNMVLVRQLLANQADPNWPASERWGWVFKGETPLGLAVRQDSTAIVSALLGAGAHPNRLSIARTPLDWAAYKGGIETLTELLQRGADPNLANHFGTTPLMTAAAEGHAEVVRILLKSGADKSKRSMTGETAKDWATVKRHTDVLRLL